MEASRNRHTVVASLVAVVMATVACAGESGPASSPDRGDSWSEVRNAGEGEVRVLYVPAEGWAYEHDGELTGVTVEIMRLFSRWIEEEHGARLRLDFVAESDWPEFYRRVRGGQGGVFGLGNVTITRERREEVAFSPPYVTNVAVLVTHEDVQPLEDEEEVRRLLADLRPLAFAGTLHEERLRELRDRFAPDRELAFADSNDEIVERVAGKGHVAFIDVYNYYRARERGIPLRRHPVMDRPGEAFGIIMPRDSDWPDPLEEFFARGEGFTRTGTYLDLLEEHLGERVASLLLAVD